MNEIKALLEELCSVSGTSGDEGAVAEICERELAKYAKTKRDALGNVIGEAGGGDFHIMLDAHMDRIGFIVTAIDKETGFLRVTSLGGNDRRVLAAAEVTVYGKKPLFGVITSTPPHLAGEGDKDALDFDKLSIDIGLSYEEAIKTVSPGDRVTVTGAFKELLNGRVTGTALDDRAGIAAVLRALEKLKDTPHNCKITAVFSSREEVGGSGARAASFGLMPNEAIAVDVSFATAPGVSEPEASPLGGGVIICCAPVLDFAMFDKLKEAATKNNIPYSVEVNGRDSGSDADTILSAGAWVKTAVLFIPQRNMHSASEVVDINDIEHTAELIAQYILSKGGNKNA